MNAKQMISKLDGYGGIIPFNSEELDITLRALRLLAAAEANDGGAPETDILWRGLNVMQASVLPLKEIHNRTVEDIKTLADFARRLERERNGLAARVRELERDAERVRLGLALSLDPLVINSDNIGGIRRSLFLPVDCLWNAMVRELTAERENQPPRHRDDVQQEIDAARGSKP